MEIEIIEKDASKTDEVSRKEAHSAPENVQIIEEIMIDEETVDSIMVEEITVEDNDELPNIQIEDVDFSTSDTTERVEDIEELEIIPQASTSRPVVPKCYPCNTYFKDMDFLKKHIQKKHPSNNSLNTNLNIAQENASLPNQRITKVYACHMSKCKYRSQSRDEMKAHRESVHSTQTNLPHHTNTVHGSENRQTVFVRPIQDLYQTKPATDTTNVQEETEDIMEIEESTPNKDELRLGREISDLVGQWMRDNIPLFDSSTASNRPVVGRRASQLLQVVRESILASQGGMEAAALTADYKMFVIGEMEKQFHSRTVGLTNWAHKYI